MATKWLTCCSMWCKRSSWVILSYRYPCSRSDRDWTILLTRIKAGYCGGISIVKDYVRTIRPRPRPREAFLTLAFAPGELAQVDWGLCRARHRPHYAESSTMPSTDAIRR